jgi:hypothetical protein
VVVVLRAGVITVGHGHDRLRLAQDCRVAVDVRRSTLFYSRPKTSDRQRVATTT